MLFYKGIAESKTINFSINIYIFFIKKINKVLISRLINLDYQLMIVNNIEGIIFDYDKPLQ